MLKAGEHVPDCFSVCVRDLTTVTLLAAVFTCRPSAGNVFELKRVWLLLDRETFIVAHFGFFSQAREGNCERFRTTQSEKVFLSEDLPGWPVCWSIRTINKVFGAQIVVAALWLLLCCRVLPIKPISNYFFDELEYVSVGLFQRP